MPRSEWWAWRYLRKCVLCGEHADSLWGKGIPEGIPPPTNGVTYLCAQHYDAIKREADKAPIAQNPEGVGFSADPRKRPLYQEAKFNSGLWDSRLPDISPPILVEVPDHDRSENADEGDGKRPGLVVP